MAAVWMKHPGLPSGQLIKVAESSVPHHQAAGWELAEAPAPRPKLKPARAQAADDSKAADAGDSADPLPKEPADPAPKAEADAKPKRTRTRTASTSSSEES